MEQKGVRGREHLRGWCERTLNKKTTTLAAGGRVEGRTHVVTAESLRCMVILIVHVHLHSNWQTYHQAWHALY